MELEEIFEQARRAFSAQIVIGEPVVSGDVTVIPAVAVRGGGGGGRGREGERGGGGGGFGLNARPVGAWVIRGEDVRWEPALDLTRLAVAAAALVAIVFLRLSR